MKEAQKDVFEVTMADRATLKRILAYIYTGEYDDHPSESRAHEPEIPVEEPNTNTIAIPHVGEEEEGGGGGGVENWQPTGM